MNTKKRDTLLHFIKTLPHTPGVYIMKDAKGGTLYIGKAGRLRNRVRSYFSKQISSPKLEILQKKVDRIEYISTPTEIEALLLEAHLINTHHPRYNTLLKDDKRYPLLKMSGEEYPRLTITRRKEGKKGKYYGPFTDATLLREAVLFINTIFPIRKCVKLPRTPCLYYHLQQCLAPCFREVKTEYDCYIKEIHHFLRGNKKSVIEFLKGKMKEAAGSLRFEEAALCKRQIKALETLRLRAFTVADPGASITLSGSIELKKILALKKAPERIMCFDVSNIQGKWAVASRVSFYREVADKENYRRYKIRTVHRIDDYAMIREALSRTLTGLKNGRESFKPDLIVIDGGKGHLNVALKVLKQEGFDTIPCIALAKEFEEVFTPKSQKPAALIQNGPAHNLLRRIRDEAHRFAISYHRSLRKKEMSASQLDSIKGIGKARKMKLLNHFGSLDEIRRASVDDICKVTGFTKALATRLHRFLRGDQGLISPNNSL
ncbi:MAG: excinuclease ABC subunit UvrC [Candidatus Omnitrophica bacterium]|nr:excinuclease ABC subunit UvrC [Candidatus Omnitrophota bacterium]